MHSPLLRLSSSSSGAKEIHGLDPCDPFLASVLVTRETTAQSFTISNYCGRRETTTHGAAGVWGPYKLSSTPDELVHAWGAETHAHLMKLIYSKVCE